tara:strand:+ start:497 stop:715 length:219 start_codon:yes stop_codon:yes gene_type:complete
MFLKLKKLSFIFIYNSCLFLLLIIGIQNSDNKSKVNFLTKESVHLPVSFIVGMSFITGSIIGNSLNFKSNNK